CIETARSAETVASGRTRTPPATDTTLQHITRALRHRNYQLFFGGQLISLTGTWMQQIAQSWLVYRLTRSSELLGLVAFAGQIPVLVFAPIGGAVADRGHRHGIVVWSRRCR